MIDYEPAPIHPQLQAAQKTSRLAYLLESLAIVVLTALAAYAASA